MEANELRIGNIVWSNDGHYDKIEDEVTGIEYNRVSTKYCKTPYLPISNIEPIPLAEKWILKFGFKKVESLCEGGYSLNNVNLSINSINEINFYLFEFGDWYIKIKFLHQLQNIFFALTGKELKSNEP